MRVATEPERVQADVLRASGYRCNHANAIAFAHPRLGQYETGGECFICGARWRVVNGRRVMLSGEESDD